MKRLLFPLILIIGFIAALIEFQIIRYWSISFIEDILAYIPLILLVILSFLLLRKNGIAFTKTKKIISYIPASISFLFVIVILGHMYFRYLDDSSKTIMTAFGYSIDNGELSFDFKENGILKGKLIQKFTERHYSGKYSQVGDTITMDIITDLKISKKVIVKGDTMRFPNDPDYFYISRP